MRKVTQNIYKHKTQVQRPKVIEKPKEEEGQEGSSANKPPSARTQAASSKDNATSTKKQPSAKTASASVKDKAAATPPKDKQSIPKTTALPVDQQLKLPPTPSTPSTDKKSPRRKITAAAKINDYWEPGTFPTPQRPVTRDSASSWPRTPNSRTNMSSRPATQGGSRLTLFSREPTITEECEDERRHLYTSLGVAVNNQLRTPRVKSRGSERSGSQGYSGSSLADMSEEERSRRAMECSYCETTFTEPKIFCCTRLCKKCLQTHINISDPDCDVACLVCRSVVPVPDQSQPRDTWADQFRTDVFLVRLQEVAEQLSETHSCYVCRTSKNKKTAATAYCFDCDTYFCDNCNEMHLQLRGLTTHATSMLAELHPRHIMSRRRVFCDRHKDRYIERFCKQCKLLMCQACADESHKKCTVVPTQQIASEKRKVLEGLRTDFDNAIRRAEEEDEMLRDRGSRMQNRISQRKDEIEAAFTRIESALAKRKERLLSELTDDGLQDGRGNEHKLNLLQTLVGALKDNGAITGEMIGCASDRDIIEATDVLVKQCNTLNEVTQNTARLTYDRPTSIARVDKYSVNTFLTLVTALGEDIDEQVVAFRTKQMGLRMPEDKENPSIKDIQLMDKNILLAADNGNMCLKGIAPREGGGHKYLRLDFKTRPWGLTKMQPNVACVSGHQCLYVITVTDQSLTLQTGVRTRKDYWSITSLSPINVAAACKFPPSIDIVDITGRRLRTIEGEMNGVSIFKQPTFLSSMNEYILITDRQDKSLVCIDQGGEVKFVHKTSKDSSSFPQGICTDEQNRAYLVDGPNVVMVSAEGKQLCQLLTSLPDPRAVTVGKDNLMAVSMDGRGVTFFTLAELKGPYN